MIDLNARGLLLADHFTGEGRLYGVDILSGIQLIEINPIEIEDFFNVHQLGPGRRSSGAKAEVEMKNGEKKEIVSYFRPQTRPFDKEEKTSVFSISVTDQNGLEPTELLKEIVGRLRDQDYEPVIERSFRLCRWEIWVFLDNRYRKEDIKAELFRLEAILHDKLGSAFECLQFPALDEGIDIYLPFQFFAGDFFGQLYQLFDDELFPLDMTEVPHTSLGGGELSLVDYTRSKTPSVEPLLHLWWKVYGSKSVRAGRLLELIEESGLPFKEILQQENRQAQIIELGNLLVSLDGYEFLGKTLSSKRSGNSRVYRLCE